MNKFSSTIDKMSVILTWSVVGLIFIISAVTWFAYIKSGKEPMVLIGVFFGPLLLLVLMSALYVLKTDSISVSDSGITIDRKAFPVQIAYDEIKNIRAAQDGEMKGAIRTFGNGGVFGYTGPFYNKKLGSMTWYCTQRKNYIIIDRTNNKRLIITPDDPAGFISAVSSFKPALITAPL